jgi:hypothetical protein
MDEVDVQDFIDLCAEQGIPVPPKALLAGLAKDWAVARDSGLSREQWLEMWMTRLRKAKG